MKKLTAEKKCLMLLKLSLMVIYICCFFAGNAFSNENAFFSYKRFFINEGAVSGGKGQSLIQRDLEAFIRKFNEGLYYISSRDYLAAEKSLQKARQLWPEYYATDFLLAQVYEELGEYKVAARYYKSYLKKLYKLRSGVYRITGPLMISFNSRGVEEYEDAYLSVKNRVEEYGINIDTVVPALDPPGILYFLLLSIVFIAAVVSIYFKLLPIWRKKKRIMDVPEGFWACRNCGTYNPDLRNECEECGRIKPGN